MSSMEATAASRTRLPQLTKYEVIEEIGHGGMATVYRARDKRLGREVAVKVIHPHLRDSREVVSRFNTEARAVAKLRHANIVEVYDVSETDEPEQYLVVELLRGTTLRKLLQQHGAMPAEVAAAFAVELLSAIAHANASGVVHRDIKPENVLIELRAASPVGASGDAQRDNRALVKLTDFGIAKLLDAQGVTSTGQVLGSPAHMAPEQIEGGEVDARSDVFGMGVLLYECMVGHLPFEGNNPAQVLRRVLDGVYPSAVLERPSIGSRWSALLDRALAHAPADRFADAGEMRDAALAELARLGIDAPRRLLEGWLEDTEGFAAGHTKAMVEKLVALGAAARKNGDAIGAAGDYNRALANAPEDTQLLRIVAGMNRAEVRTRIARQAGVALLIMLGVGSIAYGAGKMLQARPTPPIASNPVAPQPVTPPDPAPSSPPTPEPSVTVRPPPTLVLRSVPASQVSAAASASTKPIERAMRLDLTPSMGVRVGVDGPPSRDVATGDTVPLDGRAHSLAFGCPVCVPAQRDVVAGDKDDTLVVRLEIKPATLEIVGDGNATYQVVEHPEFAVRAGTNSIAMGSEFERVTVKQIESGTAVPVRLHAAHSVQAAF